MIKNPLKFVQERKEEYGIKLLALQREYYTYHYKNTCSSSGLGPFPNSELLTGNRDKVNCPWCLNYLEKVDNRYNRMKKQKVTE